MRPSEQRMMIAGALIACCGVSIDKAAAMERAVATGRGLGIAPAEIERIKEQALQEARTKPSVTDPAALVRARLFQFAFADAV